MLETDYSGISPIRDPDAQNGIAMLRGRQLPDEILSAIYHDTAHTLLEQLHAPAMVELSPVDPRVGAEILRHETFFQNEMGRVIG